VKASDLGEFGLIARIAAVAGKGASEDLVAGIGDDAAVWLTGGEYAVATTDTMVAGVHFRPGLSPWWDVGWKALAVNISDIAAMGGWPRFALVTLCLPPDTAVEDVEALYEGLQSAARICGGVTIAGGDTVRSAEFGITVAVIGRADQRDDEPLILRRSGARVGDVIAVTGHLGDAAAGLRRLDAGADTDDPLVRAHLLPRPQLAAGAIAAANGLRCAIDVSDGLLQDLGHICEASGVGAVVRGPDIPLSAGLLAAYPEEALELACTGGEDYQLVLTGPEHLVRDTLQEADLEDAAVIGEVAEDPSHAVRLLDEHGRDITFGRPGWDAFRS
jgi:thiamine-monophosphate kinase